MSIVKVILRKIITIVKNTCILPLGIVAWLLYRAYLQALIIEQKIDKLEKGKK
jgi:hypothetical protein